MRIGFALAVLSTVAAANGIEPKLRNVAAQIHASAISADVRFLADDLLEGRGTATRGERIAQQYVAARFAADGLEPGAAGSFFDRVPMRGATSGAGATLSFAGTAKSGEVAAGDFVPMLDGRSTRVDVDAPVVFVGFAIVAPGYDELGDFDLHGKIAVFYGGAPTAQSRYGENGAKLQRLAERGAAGAVIVWRDEDEKMASWSRFAYGMRMEKLFWTDGAEVGNSPPGLTMRAAIRKSALSALVAAGGVSPDLLLRDATSAARPPLPLGIRLHGRWTAQLRDTESANVVGLVRGRDPLLAKEYLVYTAHLDHLGLGEAVAGDGIYNGAVDNASGVATLLELAHAFALAPPRRSVLFVATTGEEVGFVGAGRFVAHPPVERAAIVANLNFDDVPGLHPLHDVVALGLERTSLAPLVQQAAAALDLKVSPDPEPEQHYFDRGDNKKFAAVGIPALRIHPGDGDARGDLEEGRRLHQEFLHTRYHTPKDEWRAVDDYEAMAQLARFGFYLGQLVAGTPSRPTMQ
jgi:hypothetical protein